MLAEANSSFPVQKSARDCLQLAGGLLDQGNIADARLLLQEAASLAPDEAGIYRALQCGYQAAEMPHEAIDAELAAIALEQQSALMLYNLATSYLMTQKPLLAEKWYRATLRLNNGLVMAHQNLASILEVTGRRAEAQSHRDQAYQQQNIFIDYAAVPKRTVLVLCAAATGNVPFDFLLPKATTNRIKWVMDYASEEQIATLPAYDLVFNAIGDQDVTAQSQEMVARFLKQCDKPVLNAPAAIARTSREQIPLLLKQIDHVVVPHAARIDIQNSHLAEALQDAGIAPPLLIRPVGSHGGEGLQLLETATALAAVKPDYHDCYACTYYDYRSADGYYRKYRVIFVDKQPYPYHLAISENWLVHYVSADMLAHQWKRDEEHQFLENAASVLGANVMRALRIIGQRLELDFCGLDFSILPDGRLLVFEANATMLVHLEEFYPELMFKNIYVQRILDAFDAMLQRAEKRQQPEQSSEQTSSVQVFSDYAKR